MNILSIHPVEHFFHHGRTPKSNWLGPFFPVLPGFCMTVVPTYSIVWHRGSAQTDRTKMSIYLQLKHLFYTVESGSRAPLQFVLRPSTSNWSIPPTGCMRLNRAHGNRLLPWAQIFQCLLDQEIANIMCGAGIAPSDRVWFCGPESGSRNPEQAFVPNKATHRVSEIVALLHL